ncbi:hypothetical protein JCM8097_005538 [Rhodosporidiobolus ruineniae]
MTADPEPQTLAEGSVWPGWSGALLFDLALLEFARQNDHCLESQHTHKRTERTYRYVCGEQPTSCPFFVEFTPEQNGSGDYVLSTLELGHDHPAQRLTSFNQHQRTTAADDLRRELEARAEEELRGAKKVASFRAGFEDDEQRSGFVPTWLEQQWVVWSVGAALGEQRGRKFEKRMRKTIAFVEGYPVKSTLDSPRPSLALPPSPTPPPPSSTSPRKKVVKLKPDLESPRLDGIAATLPKPILEAVKEEEEDEDEWGCRRVRGRKRKPKTSKSKTSTAVKANLLSPSSSTSTPFPLAGSSTPLIRYCKVKTPAVEPQASSSPRVDPGRRSPRLLSLPPSSASVASEPPGYKTPAPGAYALSTRPRVESAPPSPVFEVPSLPFHAPADETLCPAKRRRLASSPPLHPGVDAVHKNEYLPLSATEPDFTSTFPVYIAALLAALSPSSSPLPSTLASSTLFALSRAGLATLDDLANLVLLPKSAVRLVVEEVKKRGGTRDEVEALALLCKGLRDEAGAKDVEKGG